MLAAIFYHILCPQMTVNMFFSCTYNHVSMFDDCFYLYMNGFDEFIAFFMNLLYGPLQDFYEIY